VTVWTLHRIAFRIQLGAVVLRRKAKRPGAGGGMGLQPFFPARPPRLRRAGAVGVTDW